MRYPFERRQSPSHHHPRAQRGPMARSRQLAARPVLWLIGAGSAAASALTLLIILANSVVNLRSEISLLNGERAYLEARTALALEQWNAVSARGVVVSRAETELGLVTPDGPGIVIVMLDDTTERAVPAWRRVLGAVGGGGDRVQAVAAQPR